MFRTLCFISLAVMLAVIVSASCGWADENSGAETAEKPKDAGAKLTLKSPAFENGRWIPRRHTGDGVDVSPPLNWSDLPKGTKELALICDDPDAPGAKPWVHWVIYKIPATLGKLTEGVPRLPKLAKPFGTLQGKNSWGRIGYRGPAPPRHRGPHHYHFKLYALDVELKPKSGLDKTGLLAAMKGHILAETKLVGMYER